MEEHYDSRAASPRRSKSRRWLWALVIVLALVGLTLLLLPYGIGFAIERWLESRGVDSASIEDVDFNPFTATAVLHDLEVNAAGERVLQVLRLSLRFLWAPLRDKQIRLKELSATGVSLTVSKSPQGVLRVGGVEQVPAEQAPSPSPWTFALDRFELHDSRIRYQAPQLESTLLVKDMLLTGLDSSDPSRHADLTLVGHPNQAPLRIQAQISASGDAPGAAGTVRLEDLALAPFAAAIPQVTELQGSLSADARIEVKRDVQGLTHLMQGGTLRLCGKAVAQDRMPSAGKASGSGGQAGEAQTNGAAEQALLDLAKQRPASVKQFLVSEAGVAPDRLFICKPELDDDEEAEPRVNLLI